MATSSLPRLAVKTQYWPAFIVQPECAGEGRTVDRSWTEIPVVGERVALYAAEDLEAVCCDGQ